MRTFARVWAADPVLVANQICKMDRTVIVENRDNFVGEISLIYTMIVYVVSSPSNASI